VVIQTLYGIAPAGWMMFPILFAGFLTFTAGPSIQAVVSKSADPRTQGVTLGALQSISSLATVIGPLLGNAALAQVADLPPGDVRLGANFFICATLNLIAFTIAWRRLARPIAAAASP
jgi:DHA1 family tetracycline resistance protein-like MFS transporter